MQAILERSLPRLTQLLAASSADLVKAIIDLIATLDQARLTGAGPALRRVWQLAFAREEGIRNAVAAAFYDINIALSKGPAGAGLSWGAPRLHAASRWCTLSSTASSRLCVAHQAATYSLRHTSASGCGCVAVLHPWRCAPLTACRLAGRPPGVGPDGEAGPACHAGRPVGAGGAAWSAVTAQGPGTGTPIMSTVLYGAAAWSGSTCSMRLRQALRDHGGGHTYSGCVRSGSSRV